MPLPPKIFTLPNAPGTYILCLRLDLPHELQVGRLGKIYFSAGDYAYIGSACGPGGLRARLGRHVRGSNHSHWHIDALRAVADLVGVCFATQTMDDRFSQSRNCTGMAVSKMQLECQWCQTLAKLPGTAVPVRGFGASDCRLGCQAHLIAVPDGFTPLQVSKILTKKFNISIQTIDKHLLLVSI